MRFNDLMQTVLAADGQGSGAVTLWRQCVDLLAQRDRVDRTALTQEDRDALLVRMEQLRGAVSETQRIASVVELGTRLSSPTLIRFFAADRPSICAAAMARARLPDAAWPALLPYLGPTARGVLRGRRDTGPETRRALDAFGATDLVLGDDGNSAMLLTPEMAAPEPLPEPAEISLRALYRPAPETAEDAAEDKSQIRKLVDRIEQFTSGHKARPVDVSDPATDPIIDPVRAFAFETDAQGVLVWVDKGPRAALIGLGISAPALAGGSGPDAHVSGAFMKRGGFQNGRFTITGGELDGEWRLSAIPFFDPQSGRFQGYRGQARRPHLHEVPATRAQDTLPLAGLSGDSVRQLVHELRTPLNAILGFAEIIEQQLFGPAPTKYREMAGQIVADAHHLLTAFDDLDLAARVARDEQSGVAEPVDTALLIAKIAAHYGSGHGADSRRIDIAVARDLPPVRVDPVQGERMIQHLLRMLLSVAPVGEAVTGACWFQPAADGGRIVLAMDRPTSLKGMDEATLLDPGFSADDAGLPDAPLLGLGFSLRLIRTLALSGGGGLEVEADHFRLYLPAIGNADRETGAT